MSSGVPTTEKSSDRRFGKYPEYREYKKNTPILIPFFPGVFRGWAKALFCCEWGFYSYSDETSAIMEKA